MSGLCASCTKFSTDRPVLSSSTKKPSWLEKKDYVQEFIHSTDKFKNKKPYKWDQIVDFSMKSAANRTILYWAADKHKPLLVQDAKSAYNRFVNHGIAQCDENGSTKLYLRSPQIYRTVKKGSKKTESFFCHFHLVISNSNKTTWMSKIYTQVLVCKRNMKDVLQSIKNETALVLNALPCKFYGKDHIPGTYNLTSKGVKKMSTKELEQWLLEVSELHSSKIFNMIKSRKLNVNEIPVICYCADTECSASKSLQNELLKMGMLRVEEFPGGMKEFRSSQKNIM